jgi:16S rRNA G966 N2-methylase RsmD
MAGGAAHRRLPSNVRTGVLGEGIVATRDASRKYDRDFLLSPGKRNQLVELWEVEKYGRDCFNDADHVHLYGLPPKAWYGRGVRILARTCLEAVKDPLGNQIGKDIAEVVRPVVGNRAVGVVDPFAGSCNGLYAILRHLPSARGIGFEVEPAVFDLTTRNIAHLKAPIDVVHGNYKDLVGSRKHPADHLIVVFLAPPWGDALRPDTGLHLDRTKPPILEIVDDLEQVYGAQPVLYVTEVHEVNEPKALKAVEMAFDWSDLRIYDVNLPGLQHGVLLGTRRWPSPV